MVGHPLAGLAEVERLDNLFVWLVQVGEQRVHLRAIAAVGARSEGELRVKQHSKRKEAGSRPDRLGALDHPRTQDHRAVCPHSTNMNSIASQPAPGALPRSWRW